MVRLLTAVCALLAIPAFVSGADAASVAQNLAITVTASQAPSAVSFAPPGPVNVPDNSAAGAIVSAVQVTASDGRPFGGNLAITSQSTAGMVTLDHTNLPANIVVAKITSADDGAETVTVQA